LVIFPIYLPWVLIPNTHKFLILNSKYFIQDLCYTFINQSYVFLDILRFSLTSKWTNTIHSLTSAWYQITDTKCKFLLWSLEKCRFFLQASKPFELTAAAHTHSEHNQLPHVHVHSSTCRCTVLYYTVLPLYTIHLILNRTVLFLYTSKIIQYIWAKVKNILFHNPRLWLEGLWITRK
jgi:hypothetical protein